MRDAVFLSYSIDVDSIILETVKGFFTEKRIPVFDWLNEQIKPGDRLPDAIFSQIMESEVVDISHLREVATIKVGKDGVRLCVRA